MNRAIHLSRPDMDEEELFDTAVSISESFFEESVHKHGLRGDYKNTSNDVDIIKNGLKQVAKCYLRYTKEGQFVNFHGLQCFNGSLRQFKHVQSLIEANVEDQLARHLMIITRGDSALNIVEQTLKEKKKCKKEIIFGSHFVEDLTDDYHYRILSRIILCMEQGFVLILKDLENIYGKEFRCIVLVNENKIDFKDPPFLNRFEKQFVAYSDILQTDEEVLVRDVNKWINNVSRIQDRHFGKGDVFPYFNHEMVVSLVIWSSRNTAASHKNTFELCKHDLLQIMKPDAVLRLQHAEDYEVRSSAHILLQRYFELPLHHGLAHYIQHDVLNNNDEDACGNLTIVFTNSAIHTNISNDFKNCQTETLASFKSEKQLSINLQRFWESNRTDVLLVSCNASEDEKHLMLTKSLIEKFKAEKYDNNEKTKRVYLVIYMRGWNALYGSTTTQCSPVTQINFLSGWKLVLLDTIETPNISLSDLYLQSLSDVVENMTLTELLKKELFWAFTRIKYGSHGRDIKSVTEMLSQLERSEEFLTAIGHRVLMYIKDNETEQDIDWCSYVANDVHLLHTSSFFVDALEKFIIT
ncbi:R213A-like protein, partial [Mya arenaria]